MLWINATMCTVELQDVSGGVGNPASKITTGMPYLQNQGDTLLWFVNSCDAPSNAGGRRRFH